MNCIESIENLYKKTIHKKEIDILDFYYKKRKLNF